ncbi:porin [Telmatospirillum sp.]|uniref:porin n=1 Tax=Telmatospirillum sp. TaxID=2079197 RepID=UPI00284B2C16|nr:porin [Telmatospirillum sp.]MDR3437701.1 porin [Telmatospirillum sp.]
MRYRMRPRAGNNFCAQAIFLATTSVIASFAFGNTAHADTPIADGVSIFATVDVGVAYQSAGVPLNGASVGGLEYQAFTTTRNFNGSQTTLAENALEQSKIGLGVSEKLGDSGLSAVGRLETAFNPLSGELSNACKSLAENSGVGTPANPQGQNANYDSSRCGQAINGILYGGLASKTYGTLTFGRQLSLVQTALLTYDPQIVAPAFSFFGYSGFEAGAGSTQATRLDNSVQYTLTVGEFHAAGLYSSGGLDTGVLGRTYMADLGVTHGGLQLDALFVRANGAVNLRSSFDNGPSPTTGSPPAGLAAFISKNTSWNAMGKYTLSLANKATLALYAGYSHIEKAHADYNGGASQGDYPINVGININQTAKYDVVWLGTRWTSAKGLSISAGLYHIHQKDWTIGLGTNGNDNLTCNDGVGLLCAGNFNEASLVIDKPVVKHLDVYAGANYSVVTNGLAWGFASDQGGAGNGRMGSQDQVTLTTGVRLKF